MACLSFSELIGEWVLGPIWNLPVNLHHLVTVTFEQPVAPEII